MASGGQPPRREPGPACKVRTHLGDSGGGGRHWGSRWGPSSPALHILIHSIFGTRKGTNISVCNGSPPLTPKAPCWSRPQPPVFHLRPLTATPLRGRGRSSWSGAGQGPGGPPGAPARPLPSRSCSAPRPPFRCCSGRCTPHVLLDASGACPAGRQRVRGPWEAFALGLGLGPGTRPQPSSSQGLSPAGGAPAPPQVLGQLQQRSLPAST